MTRRESRRSALSWAGVSRIDDPWAGSREATVRASVRQFRRRIEEEVEVYLQLLTRLSRHGGQNVRKLCRSHVPPVRFGQSRDLDRIPTRHSTQRTQRSHRYVRRWP